MGNYVEFLNYLKIMKPNIKMQDFWEYVARIQEEVTNEVLDQITEDEYDQCWKTVNDYMYNLRNVQFGVISTFNKIENKYIPLINKALKKRNIFIYSDCIAITFC